MDRALEIAREICQRSPEANRHIKALTGRQERSRDRDSRLQAELEHFAVHLRGADLARGLQAFRAKQTPRFQDP
jgi:enoyl-CoA hydratase/carnithine racemase